MSDNIIQAKSFEFAIKIVNLYKFLSNDQKEYCLSKQILKSGTSIGANIREGIEGQSRNDFISKFGIALKEASETKYWIELLIATDYISEDEGVLLKNEVSEIIKILNSIIKTSRQGKTQVVG